MSHTSFIFQVLMVEIVKFYHALSRTLFSAQQTNNILHFFSLQSEQRHLWSFSISYSFRHAAEIWPTSNLHFFSLQSEQRQIDHSLSRTLFGTKQKCDKHRTLFRFTKWKKSSLIIFCFELYTARSRNGTYIAHFFFLFLRLKIVKFDQSVSCTLFSTHVIATNILS